MDQTQLPFVMSDGWPCIKGKKEIWVASGSPGLEKGQCTVQLKLFADAVSRCSYLGKIIIIIICPCRAIGHIRPQQLFSSTVDPAPSAPSGKMVRGHPRKKRSVIISINLVDMGIYMLLPKHLQTIIITFSNFSFSCF